MQKLFYLFLFLIIAAGQSFSQIHMQVSNEENAASYPVDGTIFLKEEQKKVAEYIKNHPDYLNKMRLGKSAAWGFTVGSTKKWYAVNFSTGSHYQTDATCRAVGNKCYVFVEDSMWNTRVNQAAVDSIVANFENRTPADPNKGIYDTDVDVFGNEPDSDNDPKIIILILNVRDTFNGSGGYVAGYYSSLNQTGLPNSNQADMMYVDANPSNLASPTGLKNVLATFAHEFQHMIHWNANQFDPDLTFMNEGASEVAEVICGYPMRTQHLYANETNRYLFAWSLSNDPDEVLNDYQRASRFFLNILDQFGKEIFKPLVNSVTEGASAIETALITNGTPKSFNDVFTNWLIANKLDDKSINPSYGYIYSNLQKVNSKATFTGPAGSDSDQLDNLAANYYTFTSGSNLSINFTVDNNIIIKAIKIGDSQKEVVDVPLNTQTIIAGYGTTYHTVHFAVINLDHNSNRNYSFSAAQTVASVQELKWDETEPVGYYVFSQSDTICVVFNGVQGARLDSIRIALRKAGSISGGIYEYTGNIRPTPLGEELSPITATISTTSPNPYPVPYENWTTVDLRQYDISADNAFAAAFVIGNDPSTPGVMVTEYESTTPYHSFTYLNNPSDGSPPNWFFLKSSETTVPIYLIRAYVSFGATEVKQVVELAPKKFDLFQNYPNPFNPATTISFYIPKTEAVTLKIYNALGREIKTVISRNMHAGHHTINLKMNNQPSGVYFYRLSAGDFTETKKLMLLK